MALINDFISLIAIIFGIFIIVYPDLLAYLVGVFLIIYGIIKLSHIYIKRVVKI